MKVIRKARRIIDIPLVTDSGKESVCEITGTAIPAWFEYQLRGTMTIHDRLTKLESPQASKKWVRRAPTRGGSGRSKKIVMLSDSDSSDDEAAALPDRASDIALSLKMSAEELMYSCDHVRRTCVRLQVQSSSN